MDRTEIEQDRAAFVAALTAPGLVVRLPRERTVGELIAEAERRGVLR